MPDPDLLLADYLDDVGPSSWSSSSSSVSLALSLEPGGVVADDGVAPERADADHGRDADPDDVTAASRVGFADIRGCCHVRSDQDCRAAEQDDLGRPPGAVPVH